LDVAVTFLLALVFGVAGATKARGPTVFRAALRDLLPRPAVAPVAVALPG
jgi:hypothetical protein